MAEVSAIERGPQGDDSYHRMLDGTSRIALLDSGTTDNPYIMTSFGWDPDKAARNLIDHKVSFEQAAVACRDRFAVEWIDEREDYGEERCGLLGLYGREVLYVAYTERHDMTWIISARRAERHEKDRYYRQNAR